MNHSENVGIVEAQLSELPGVRVVQVLGSAFTEVTADDSLARVNGLDAGTYAIVDVRVAVQI